MIPIKKITCLFIFCFILLSGCSLENSRKAQHALFGTVNPKPIFIGDDTSKEKEQLHQIKQMVTNFDEIYDVAVVQSGQKILVVYKVKQMSRFRMKKIENRVEAKLKKEFPQHEFIISSDIKIFFESVKLGSYIEKNNIKGENAQKRFDDILFLQKDSI